MKNKNTIHIIRMKIKRKKIIIFYNFWNIKRTTTTTTTIPFAFPIHCWRKIYDVLAFLRHFFLKPDTRLLTQHKRKKHSSDTAGCPHFSFISGILWLAGLQQDNQGSEAIKQSSSTCAHV